MYDPLTIDGIASCNSGLHLFKISVTHNGIAKESWVRT